MEGSGGGVIGARVSIFVFRHLIPPPLLLFSSRSKYRKPPARLSEPLCASFWSVHACGGGARGPGLPAWHTAVRDRVVVRRVTCTLNEDPPPHRSDLDARGLDAATPARGDARDLRHGCGAPGRASPPQRGCIRHTRAARSMLAARAGIREPPSEWRGIPACAAGARRASHGGRSALLRVRGNPKFQIIDQVMASQP